MCCLCQISDDFGAERQHESGGLQDASEKGSFLKDSNFCPSRSQELRGRGSPFPQYVISFKPCLFHSCTINTGCMNETLERMNKTHSVNK